MLYPGPTQWSIHCHAVHWGSPNAACSGKPDPCLHDAKCCATSYALQLLSGSAALQPQAGHHAKPLLCRSLGAKCASDSHGYRFTMVLGMHTVLIKRAMSAQALARIESTELPGIMPDCVTVDVVQG